MHQYYFCKDITAEHTDTAMVAYPDPAAAVINYLLYGHPSSKYICRLSRRDDKSPYQLTTARPHDTVSFFLSATNAKVSDGNGLALYGDHETVTESKVDLSIQDLCYYYRIPLTIEKH
ncbi:hypothetical protein PHOBOS_22 [Erwinia phage vB_EamM_Phobos]|uniref:hypothetical protein n=1 Tax=Erwinia phage vB_EamM_Phobos TaxID=1883377 RepID=UPI00081C4A8E|nr:hypothetical protein BIZ79_gp022 [Erwinia phage vB_EamM_Phobos]ANZ50212.1 hypothetical protein PHOBOS_22 [Erwinia phage vB_EamM_Phobos]